ncbi:MAG: HEAT repeat domain-containing protein [Gemmatimonadetes bacterium]|nr:HEAT repeat domain-containing protein [Gemmatimonadota bacterium]
MTPPPDGAGNSAFELRTATTSRVDEVGPDTPIPAQEAADLFAMLDKAVRAQRLYQPNNPVYRSFIAATESAFAKLWDRLPSLTVGIEENSFRWFNRSFPAGEGRESMPFLFYKDGIRFITFLPGFEDEIERFLDVVNRARSQDQRTDDDMVTLLWQQEFASFQYSYVDALAEGLQVPRPTTPKLVGLELTLVRDDAAGELKGEPQPPAVEAGKPTVAGLINRDDFEETLYFLDSTELEHLREEVEREWNRDVKMDVLNGLFDRLEDTVPEWRTEILQILRQMLPVYMGAGDLRSATLILVELNVILERAELSDDDRAAAQELFRELSEPTVLTQLMRSLEDGSIDPSGTELGVFLKHLGPSAMPVLLAAIERTEVTALQERLRTAIEGLANANRDRVVALLSEKDPQVLRGAARLAGQLTITQAAPSLAQLLQHSDAIVRRIVVESLIRIRTALALDAIQQALGDADRDVRVAAARGLATLRYAPARGRIEEFLDSRIVRDADLTEKLAFFEAYGAVATADSVALLDRMLNGRKLFGKESPEMRACAAMALGRVGSPAARAALQRSSGESNPIVRNAVMKALRQDSA